MEYRSKAELLGLPLVHFCLAVPTDVGWRRKQARGWIAIGDTAIGGLLAIGGGAVGTLAIGGASVGVLSLGGASLGVLALGGGAVGYWALGGAALGYQAALGGLAIAGQYAMGGLAIAGEYAAGGAAHAPHVNDEATRAFFAQNLFFQLGQGLVRFSPLAFLFLLLPLYLNRKRPAEGQNRPIG